MALQSYTIAVGNLQDDTSGNNYAVNKAVYILKQDKTIQPIFADFEGNTPITQDGVNNVTNNRGEFSFYVEPDDYIARVGGIDKAFTVVGSDYFNNQVDDAVNLIIDSVAGRGAYYPVGSFEAGFTYTDINQVGTYGTAPNITYYVYTGGIENLPHSVTAGTDPTASSLYENVFYNSADAISNASGGTVQNQLDIKDGLTLSEAINYNGVTGLLGSRVWVTDRKAWFIVVLTSSVTPNGMSVIQSVSNTAYSFAIENTESIELTQLGAVQGSGNDNSAVIKFAIENYKKVKNDHDSVIYSSDIAAVCTSDTDFTNFGELYFTGDVASSFTPIAFDIDCGGYDFKIGGGGYIDFENHSAPIIRRRLLDIGNAADVQVYGYKSRSCKTIIQSFTGNVTRVRFKSPETTVHQADGTGLISVNFKQGGDVNVNTLVANIENQAEVVDILKVTGGTNVVADASKSVNVKDNFIHNLGGGNSEVDIFSGGRECTVDNNTFINVSVQTKNNYLPESIKNNHIILSKNKFFLDEDGMTLCIYRRSGKIKILDNFFIARSDQTLMDSVINLDKEDINSTASKDDQGDIIIDGNICDMRTITADNSTFSFVLTDTLSGTDLEKLHCIFSDNIVRGCNGLMRGNMFSNSVCRGGVFDMAGKTNYSTGNFTFKKIDGLTVSTDTPYLLTNTPTVQNSPRVAMRDYYSDAALISGELDIKERDVFVLTDGNLNGTTYIDNIKNHTIKQFIIINRSSSSVTISLSGDQSRTLAPLGQILVMPYNDSDFTETRIRFKATVF